MHCQKPGCLNALNCFILVTFSKGDLSRIVLSFFKNLKNSGLTTKNPPLIQLSPATFFSLNFVTLFPLISNAPNLAGGLTAVTVTIFLFFL